MCKRRSQRIEYVHSFACIPSPTSSHSFIWLSAYAENDGSAFWFLSATSDADKATTWFHGMNEELDLETHLATVDEWAQAPFKVYICQQRLGDFILVPKRSCHQVREQYCSKEPNPRTYTRLPQVINHGGLNIKTSWSRMSVESLELSLDIELSIYRRYVTQPLAQ